MRDVEKVYKARNVLKKILEDSACIKCRTGEDMYTNALSFAADLLPKSPEKTALSYLARNPGADIVLDMGDNVITSGIKKAIEIMEKK